MAKAQPERLATSLGAKGLKSPARLGFVTPILGGSWVVKSMCISPLIWVITIVTLLITPLITTHEPPSTKHHRPRVCSWSKKAALKAGGLRLLRVASMRARSSDPSSCRV